MDNSVRQNLIDAGFDEKLIDEFEKCCDCCDDKKEFKILQQQRDDLLGKVHTCHKQIDCLDYLVYKLNKEKEKQND